MEQQPSPETVAAYDAWREQAHDAGTPVYGSLCTLLYFLTGMSAVAAALIALMLVSLGTFLGTVWWVYEHSEEWPGHTA